MLDGVNEIKRVINSAKEREKFYQQKTVLFVDEIHRWAKNVQDALLPWVEEGLIILIGATVENPMFTINPALRSRSRIVRLEPLAPQDILILLQRALKDKERGLGQLEIQAEEGALEYLAHAAGGDARVALNTLEFAALISAPEGGGPITLTKEVLAQALQQRPLSYDKEEEHYNCVSAWIKSMRGSDPDAALYWLARMLKAGEDPLYLARRLMVHAAEDVGLADPQALLVAAAAALGVERVGLPEGRLLLAQATLYIALAPKSNSVIASIEAAMAAVEREGTPPVPAHLRDASYPGAKALGHGQGYKYPHQYPRGWVEQDYLPASLKGKEFYRPKEEGEEARLKAAWQERTRRQG